MAVLAAASAQSAHDARNGKVNPIAGRPGTRNDDINNATGSFPLDDSFLARPSNLRGVHLKVSIFIE